MNNMDRRSFIKNAGMATAALSAMPVGLAGCRKGVQEKLMLMRYDTEWWGEPAEMAGFLEKLVEVHRRDEIPVTMFCRGLTLENMKSEFTAFHQETEEDPLFDMQDHSYSHIGLGYERGKPVDILKADYERSFHTHSEVFGLRPTGISICGTSDDGPSLPGFDATEKSKAEFEMVVKLGTRMINSFLTGIDGSREFINYDIFGHPEVMGFISGYSDTAWMYRKEHGDPVDFMLQEVRTRTEQNEHMPVMFHDWVAWQKAPDKELTHVRRIAETGRQLGYTLVTHMDCYHNKPLWQRV
jgi:peptidoglycan/xylan/chitin deacetylase (PgdA/CDA1 family)